MAHQRFTVRWLSCVATIVVTLGGPAHAQITTENHGFLGKLNPFHTSAEPRPLDVPELCRQLDCLGENLRDDGLVVLKQPDVFSQARMTHFRNDFDQQMQIELGRFHLVLAARINRLDGATLTQTTNLSAALAAPGTTAVHVAGSSGSTMPSAPTGPPAISSTATGTPLPLAGAFSNFGLDGNNSGNSGTLALGVDPTVFLDEKKRFLEHLNQIRRINFGPDQNDSSGYGLYLVRLPISITPGEKTYQGFGADMAMTVEHEFTPDFLPKSFQSLVINDIVDQLGPVVFEVIRSGAVDKFEDPREIEEKRREIILEKIKVALFPETAKDVKPDAKPPTGKTLGQYYRDEFRELYDKAEKLSSFILRGPLSAPGESTSNPGTVRALDKRLDLLLENHKKIVSKRFPGFDRIVLEIKADLKANKPISRGRVFDVEDGVFDILYDAGYFESDQGNPGMLERRPFSDFKIRKYIDFVLGLYRTALTDDISLLDDALGLSPDQRAITGALLPLAPDVLKTLTLSLPSTRSSKQIYPIAPREVVDFFLPANILLLAKDVKQSLMTSNPRANDVRNYLRHSLWSAYIAMSTNTNRQVANALPSPLNDPGFMERINDALRERQFDSEGKMGALSILFNELVDRLEQTRDNIRKKEWSPQPIAALCWAIAIDAALLDYFWQQWIPKVFEERGIVRAFPVGQHFYFGNNSLSQETKDYFNDFVKTHWPIITFALDPVTDQQNVADSFNLKRDLQLAVSYAFATGQISFGQLNTFRRQIEQSSDTIALNRTVTGFAHGNETFGFRFTPRVQNPPMQRTNLGVITSQLISGGPGPDYQIKKSKLEGGMRELTAVLLIPTFLPSMRMNVSTNWFKLNDPEHLVFHSVRAMERGRQVQELTQAVQHACNLQQYRADDVRVLQAKLRQLEAMLPMQSKVVQLPYENTASGFDLYSDGATALVPELSGYDGIDIVKEGQAADIFIYGKYINLLDTRVIIGGAFVPNQSPGQTQTTQASTQASTSGATTTGTTTGTTTVSTTASGAVDILSREVVHVQIPATASPTVTSNDGKSYFEVYLATPNGISNRVLVPCQPKGTSPTLSAYDLAPGATNTEVDIFYQWINGPDGKPKLILTDDFSAGGKVSVAITWDDRTGFAPKTLQANFQAKLSTGQTLNFSLPADSGTKDDYSVDRRKIATSLLNLLEPMTPPPSALPASILLTVTVQPYIPQDSMGFRVKTAAKPMNTPLTVKFIYNATGKDATAAPAPASSSLVPAPRMAPNDAISSEDVGKPDRSLIRTAQVPRPNNPISNLVEPSTLPPLPNPSSLGTTMVPPLNGATVSQGLGNLQLPQTGSFSTNQTTLDNVMNQLAKSATQPPQIVVNPSPVVVVSPAATPASKHQSRLGRLFHRGSKPQAGPPPQR